MREGNACHDRCASIELQDEGAVKTTFGLHTLLDTLCSCRTPNGFVYKRVEIKTYVASFLALCITDKPSAAVVCVGADRRVA